jgi:peptidase E
VSTPQVFAFSGMLRTADDELTNAHLLAHALALTACEAPRVCYLPTALGDAEEAVAAQRRRFADAFPDAHFSVLTLFPQPSVPDVRRHLLSQHLLLVEGGSVVNLMAVWRAHRLDAVLRECWEAGVVLSWHLGGPTDSFRDALDPFTDGLGLLPFSNGVHDDFDDQPRRTTYRRLVAEGALPPGYASEDGVGLHYVGTELREAVSVRRGAQAWWVDRDGARPVPTRYLDPAAG